MNRTSLLAEWLLAFSVLVSAGSVHAAQSSGQQSAPFLGWNSYDCYGSHIKEKQTLENLDAFTEKLKPYGYDFFVLDAGWYRHYDLKPGEVWPTDGDKKHLAIDEYGRYIPSKVLFPNGLKPIAERAHRHGIKFGIHLMRGIPREAVTNNLPIKGTEYFARDIADTNDICSWSTLNYGINMDRPGAQEYYDSVLALAAEWGIDFIKYDDIVHKPREIEAVIKARRKAGRDIVLSVSPGNDINPEYLDLYRQVEMVRISKDIWDLQEDIDESFERWERMAPFAGQGFWLDLDMIPFGHIRIHEPLSLNNLDSARGYDRMDLFSYAQKKTFITQRAMAASPLFMGGDLTSSPGVVFELITNADMLACNQNGITGRLAMRISNHAVDIDVWNTPHKQIADRGWVGIFNRNEYADLVRLDKEQLGLNAATAYELYDIWNQQLLEDADSFVFRIPGNDVVFIRYRARQKQSMLSGKLPGI